MRGGERGRDLGLGTRGQRAGVARSGAPGAHPWGEAAHDRFGRGVGVNELAPKIGEPTTTTQAGCYSTAVRRRS